MSDAKVEPWLRGTLTEIDPVRRQVLHALELAAEDAARWCTDLSPKQMDAEPFGVASVGFHLRHIGRSLNRLLTYAMGSQLSIEQIFRLHTEMRSSGTPLAECLGSLAAAARQVCAIDPETYDQPREVGRKHLPATVVGLLIHCAEHTQRHIGQAITTAKIVRGMTTEAASKTK